jgi:hypothetical protein
MEFGNVQRGILGVEGGRWTVSHLKSTALVWLKDFTSIKWPKGADKAGLAKGDVIVK